MYDKWFPRSEGFLEKRFLSATSMLMKVANRSGAAAYLNELKTLKKIMIDYDEDVEVDVEVNEVASLNSSQGTIFAPELKATSTEKISAMKRVDTDR